MNQKSNSALISVGSRILMVRNKAMKMTGDDVR